MTDTRCVVAVTRMSSRLWLVAPASRLSVRPATEVQRCPRVVSQARDR
ncbi:hypothetical protein KPSA3_07422 [Pseudomonas syringae pv. actinidiae]|uniref:Uncharacterized protein n=1 Tax=Pseudomonas syringae pv. actinidiae TaxID=103796 RepID=A0AAN4TPX5_PSESF|nr:hypothetical protein KPSA3_07422 [Pseudomonas syringae pv. actinidiae]